MLKENLYSILTQQKMILNGEVYWKKSRLRCNLFEWISKFRKTRKIENSVCNFIMFQKMKGIRFLNVKCKLFKWLKERSVLAFEHHLSYCKASAFSILRKNLIKYPFTTHRQNTLKSFSKSDLLLIILPFIVNKNSKANFQR